MLILVTGARDHTDRALIEDVLTWCVEHTRDAPGRRVALLHGACPRRRVGDSWGSADWLAECVATERGWEVLARPASWYRSPLARNRAMVAEACRWRDRCDTRVRVLAFPVPCARPDCRIQGGHWSHGTAHCARVAAEAGLSGWWVLPDGDRVPLAPGAS